MGSSPVTTLNKTVTVSGLFCSHLCDLVRVAGTRYMGSSPVTTLNTTVTVSDLFCSHLCELARVAGTVCMGSNSGACQKPSRRSRRASLGPNPNVIGWNPGDVKTQNRNLNVLGSNPRTFFFVHTSNLNVMGSSPRTFFFVQTSNLNVMGSSPRTFFCSKS